MKFVGISSVLFFTASCLFYEASSNQKTLATTVNNITRSLGPDFLSSLNASKDISLDDLTDDLENWIPPKELSERFPYYLSGYDYEDRPIWVSEMGKFPIREYIEKGPEAVQALTKYAHQAARFIAKSMTDRNPNGDRVNFLSDFDQFGINQISSIDTTRFIISLTRTFRSLFLKHMEVGIVINANYVTETLINILRPIVAALLERMEIYGTKKSKWIPLLLRRFPSESLPEWYGGSKDHQPIAVRG